MKFNPMVGRFSEDFPDVTFLKVDADVSDPVPILNITYRANACNFAGNESECYAHVLLV